MRITNSMMSDMFLRDANNSLSRVYKYQNQVDSTKRVSSISDDPQATMVALKARNKLSNLSMYQSNIETVKSYLTEAESAADGLNELLQSAYEELVSATSGSKNEDDLSLLADEIDSFKNEAVTIGNTSMGTSFIFGGYNFAGTTDGVNLTQPFSINKATGQLIYNGINLSKVSWSEDYEENVDLMLSYTSGISDNTTALDTASSDSYARDTLCQNALSGLNNLVESGKQALNAAVKYGIDEGSDEYKRLYTIIHGSGNKGESGYVMGLEDYAADLYNEISKELASEIDPDNTANAFSITNAKAILSGACELIYNTGATEGLDYSLSEAADSVQALIDADLTAEGALTKLANESAKRAVLQIGYGHSMEYTFTGMDLMGSGTENIYYILDKCSAMLRSGDSEGLSKMVTEVQAAQERVLAFVANIGTSENRMEMLSGRYTSSELNYKEMRSDAVDADMAEAITNLTTAQTVYNAALAGGAEILQTSLIDFLS